MRQRAPTPDTHQPIESGAGGARFVAPDPGQADGPREEVEEPARLLRIASTQQMAAQQQLARMRAQQANELPGSQPGHYL